MPEVRQSVHHIAIRYAALASKPALLWFLVSSGRTSEAAALGSLMLVASVIGMAMSNEAHLQLYATIFGRAEPDRTTLYRHLSTYLRSIVTHIVLIIIPTSIVCILLFPTVNPLFAVGLALAERVSDELLRIKLYRKEWNRWTFLLFAKNIFPALPALAGMFWLRGSIEAGYALGGLAFSIWLLSQEDKAVKRALASAFRKLPDIGYIGSHLSTYIRVLSARQIAAILSLNVITLDRYVGMNLWGDEYVAYLVFAGQIINGIFFVAEAKHLSEHRANFIDPVLRLDEFWRWRPYIYLLIACILIASIVFSFGTGFGFLPTMPQMLYLSVFLMIVNYAVFYLSIPLNDYLYYRGFAKPLAMWHFALFATYPLMVLIFEPLATPAAMLAVLMTALVCRAALLIMARNQLDGRPSIGANP